MSRRRVHEEEGNHEAWAIPYADLMTLLLAFFVVMYAISSVNAGKYRVMADALNAAFGGTPKAIAPIQLGQRQLQGAKFDQPSPIQSGAKRGPTAASPVPDPAMLPSIAAQLRVNLPTPIRSNDNDNASDSDNANARHAAPQKQLHTIATKVEQALKELVDLDLVTVRRSQLWLEVEIRSDILFDSGLALPRALAVTTVKRLATVLQDVPNAVRIEGYTDNVPIRTMQYPSNWELSAARAASVVHIFTDSGIPADRLAVVGYGEQRPREDNSTASGRGANRRVVLIILAEPEDTDPALPDTQLATPAPALNAIIAPGAESTADGSRHAAS